MNIFKCIRFCILVLVFLVCLIFMTGFVAENHTSVELVLLGYRFSSVPFSALMVIAFFIGGIIGLFSSTLVIVKLQLRNFRMKRKLHKRDKELEKLRIDTLKRLS